MEREREKKKEGPGSLSLVAGVYSETSCFLPIQRVGDCSAESAFTLFFPFSAMAASCAFVLLLKISNGHLHVLLPHLTYSFI